MTAMSVEMGPEGATVPAEALGPLLGVAPADVPGLMRAGAITSRFERGEGEDAGRCRLTFWHAGRRVRLTCDAEGRILTTSRAPASRGEPGAGGPAR